MVKALSTTASEAIPQGNLRKSILFINADGAINIHLKKERANGLTVSTSDFDVRLSPGGSFAMNVNDDGEDAVQGRWTAVAASGTPSLVIFETIDRRYN